MEQGCRQQKRGQRELASALKYPHHEEIFVMNRVAPQSDSDRIPAQATEADFSRLASIVTMERYGLDPKCLWSPSEVASNLWDCRALMTFPLLAFVAMAIARDTRFKDVDDIYLIAAGLIDPDQHFAAAGVGK